jgi:hypothetical protein
MLKLNIGKLYQSCLILLRHFWFQITEGLNFHLQHKDEVYTKDCFIYQINKKKRVPECLG